MIRIVNNLSTAFDGKKPSKQGKGKGKTQTSPAPSETRIRRISPTQLKASLKARTVQE
jgi:hypothetical protein